MKIVVDLTEAEKILTFGELKINNFFLCTRGNLCQKYTDNSYNKITDADGNLCSGRVDNCAMNLIIHKRIDLAFKLRNEIS